MGFFSGIANAFKKVVKAVTSTVGKVLATAAAVIAAPFTGGLSLLAIPAVLGLGRKNVKSLGKFTGADPVGKPIEDPVKRYPVKEKKVEVKPVEPIEEVISGVGKGATTGTKEDVTLFGYYNKVNFVTIPVDNDFGNIRVVDDTYFPYIAVVNGHTPSNGLRYVSRFTFDNLLTAYQNNLDKVLYDLDKDNGNFSYITFNWNEFVDKYLSNAKGLTADNGKLKWTLTPDFMLKWLDGDTKPTFLLDYSYGIPAGVKTVFDLEGDSKEATESPIQKATYSPDPNKISRLQNLLGAIGSGVAYANLALATAGQIKSRFANAAGAVKNLSETAKGLQGKFNDVKGMLTKDYINGKISDLKSLVNKSLPKKGSFKSFFVREKKKIKNKIAELKQKQKLRREKKDPKVKLKLGGVLDKATGALDKVSSKLDTLPKIPKGLTKGINAVSKLSSGVGNLGGGLSFKSLVSTALPGLSNLQLPSFKNINWANPLDALDGITGGLEAVNSIGQKVVNTNFDINVPKGVGPFYAMNEKEAKIARETALSDKLAADFAARQAERSVNVKTLTIVPIEIKKVPTIQPPSMERILASTPSVSNVGTKAPGPFVATSDKAYFHSNSNASSRRSAYIVRGQGGTFTKTENNFGYLTFTYNGKVTEGWIQLSDVKMG